MTPDAIFRDARARHDALEQYEKAHERLAELEQSLMGKGKVYEAQGAHDIAVAVLRGLMAEHDDPEPQVWDG